MFLFYTFKVIPGRIDFVLSLVLHLLLFSLVNELYLPRLPEVLSTPFQRRKCCNVTPFFLSLPNF